VTSWRNRRGLWLILGIVLLLTILPYLLAANAGGEERVFAGFLLNPMDSNTYLAKMYQGWRGDWLYTLPYTAEKSQGAYLFLLYIFLGHLSRLTGISLLLVFHAARILAAIAMLIALHRFCRSVLPVSSQANYATLLAAFGSGLGWLALPFGSVTSDFWVAEAYPFLSAYANPHFPLSIALLLWILTTPAGQPQQGWNELAVCLRQQGWVALLALLLAVASPFAVVLALGMLGGMVLWERVKYGTLLHNPLFIARFAWVALAGLPPLVYDVWVTSIDPLLSAWNAQNQTPSPPLWDLLLSFSPLLILAVIGGWRYLRDRNNRLDPALDRWQSWRIPITWAALALFLMILPVSLQRRFILGFYIPLAVLAVPGLVWLSAGREHRCRILAILLFIMLLPTNLMVLLAARHGAQTLDPQLYLYRDEVQAFQWLRQNARPDALVLASPQIGLFIPARTGLRVIYGHPFETVNAQEEEQAVEDFFGGASAPAERLAFLDRRGVGFVFYGPRERALGTLPSLSRLHPIYQAGQVTVLALLPVEVVGSRDAWIHVVR